MPADLILRVALPVPLPRHFDYLPPERGGAVPGDVGRRVRVPFGSRELTGVVVEAALPESASTELRTALAWLDEAPLLHGELLQSLRWLSRYAHAPLGEVLATALPVPLRHGEALPDTATWAWSLTDTGRAQWTALRAGSRPRLLAERLQASAGPVPESLLDLWQPGWRATARTLAGRGLLQRLPVDPTSLAAMPVPGPEPNDEQRAALEEILAARGFQAWLLEGVTGSGKTEVYLHAIADCLARGRQALLLVPEIGLTPQALARLESRLGVPVHALHSGLNDNERARAWTACARGEARVVVGTRSAIFTPLPQAGLIVIDEEHDGSYKQQDGMRYHARDFALVRAHALDVPVILGSATPALETLNNAAKGRYSHLRLSRRAGDARPPTVRVVDVRKRPLDAGLTADTVQQIARTLEEGGQVLVFKNRRGYAPVLLCHDCGWSAQCRRCDAPMTVHGAGRRLQCHHCGNRQAVPPACPDCGGLALQPQGIGTERLEEMLAARFEQYPVLRIDRGTTQRRDALGKQLAAFGEQPGILVGTQILAKGHDLPQLALVVVVGVDEGLFSADFRAGERLAQQLIQVSGRAGRAQRPGQVWLQTHHPDHPLLHTLITGGYPAFAAGELAAREAAGFPPFAHLALLRAEAQQVEAASTFLLEARSLLEAVGPPHGDAHVQVQGPVAAPMPRRAGMQRMQLLLTAQRRVALHRMLDGAMPSIHELRQARKVRWSLDVDPLDLY